jgi:hypothetical protein
MDWNACEGLPIIHEFVQFKRTLSPVLFQYLLSFLLVGKRSPGRKTPEMEAGALATWLQVEERMPSEFDSDLVTGLATLADLLLSPSFQHCPLPHHGGGAVADAKGTLSAGEKHKYIHKVWCIEAMLSSYGRRVEPSKFIPESASWPNRKYLKRSDCLLDAELLFVDQDKWKLRSICKEPTPYQFSQQSVRFALENAIEASPLGRFINIHDQSMNSSAAIAASWHNRLDTLDLSRASDSVSMALVNMVFPKKVLMLLKATRSLVVRLPNGSRHELKKFAPMGSAVCFPSQSILYTLICLLAYHEFVEGSMSVSKPSLTRLLGIIGDDPYNVVSGLGTIRVYGDDIICDSRITTRIVEMLTHLGFVINESKSYTGNVCFRESCGTYALQGYDCSPLTIKLVIDKNGMTPPLYSGLAGLANRAYRIGYMNVRNYMLRLLHYLPGRKRESYPRPVPYDGVTLEGSPYREVAFKKRLYRPGKVGKNTSCLYQRDEGRFLVCATRVETEDPDGVYGFVAWMRSPNTVGTGKPVSSVRDYELRLQWVWLPI